MSRRYCIHHRAAVVALVLFVPVAGSDTLIYQCGDADGGVVFGDRPCSGVPQGSFSQAAAPAPGSRVVKPDLFRRVPPAASGRRSAVIGDDRKNSGWCSGRQSRLERINAELRAGYTPSRGERLRGQRRVLEDEIRERCR